jgi:hypothetical protein
MLLFPARLKIPRRKACRFDSGPGTTQKSSEACSQGVDFLFFFLRFGTGMGRMA